MGPVVAPVVAPAAVPPSQSVFKQPQPVNPNSLPFFSRISEDILVNVLSRLEDDPRDLARLACVCRRFTNVIRTSCWRHQCMRVLPTVVSELMQSSSQPELLGEPPCGWGSLQKLLVCCPGLRHAGVLLDCFDFGLERAIGKSDDYQIVRKEDLKADASAPSDGRLGSALGNDVDPHVDGKFEPEKSDVMIKPEGSGRSIEWRPSPDKCGDESSGRVTIDSNTNCNHEDPHLAKGIRMLTREQGNKLLASRFRADSLYICDWPGCVHPGEKRMYKLFRGIFKNFKQSHVWRNLRDHQAKKSELSCAFCSALSTWDMVTTFCLRRSFEYHEDGEPVVRAYVCENGHVAGAWTDRPLYNL
ncbi:unnamed protein product [Sphagnum troendelagicum]|uniref:F-box domain-containing protein n=1 Tax=Sphagnum troendelagicum TaxID=128251 RepID=A0ABP0TZ46_9BRYO